MACEYMVANNRFESIDTNEKKTEAKQESQDELNVRNGNVATNEVLR